MIIEEYNEIVSKYKNYMENSSQYYTIDANKPLVVKGYTNTTPYFPLIATQLSNITNTDYCTIDKIENYNELYLTLDIYTKNKTIDNTKIASELINDELTNLTIKFFESINMKMTLCKITPNLDTSILRRTIQVQGLVGNARKNIIRR